MSSRRKQARYRREDDVVLNLQEMEQHDEQKKNCFEEDLSQLFDGDNYSCNANQGNSAKKAFPIFFNVPESEKEKQNMHSLMNLHDEKNPFLQMHAVRDVFQFAIDGDTLPVLFYLAKNPKKLNVPNGEGYHLIHLAIMNNQIGIFQELVRMGADLKVVDPDGRTVLHQAVLAKSVEMVSVLLKTTFPPTTTDSTGMMAIHLAAEIGLDTIVKLLLPVHHHLNVRGEGGLTPLHVAAINNHGSIASILMQNGASAMTKDDRGNYPIHSATKNASNFAIESIVSEAQSSGLQTSQIMSVKDSDRNMPIHCAVISGNVQTVKICLTAGAHIGSEQENGTSAFHLVAAQGNVAMAKVMHDAQSVQFEKTINSMDDIKRSPLHWAAVFNHDEMASYLLDNGARINAIDIDGNTPLLIAANKGYINVLQILIKAGAELQIKDKTRRNFLHLLVLAQHAVPDMTGILKAMTNYQNLMTSRDVFGFTPLHYAVKCGHLTMFNDLVKLGSPLCLKSNKKQTILHLAAQFGRLKICQKVLSMKPNLQNETDVSGMTPLHIAALCGQLKVLYLLMDIGVSASKDKKKNSPLHLAASTGRVGCMKALLTTHRNLLNLTNFDGDTALHLAAQAGFVDAVVLLLSEGAIFLRNNNNYCFYDEVLERRHQAVALAIIQHPRWHDVFHLLSAVHGTFLVGLVRRVPDICLNVLDQCVTESELDPSSDDYWVEYNFQYLNLPENFIWFAEYNRINYVPLLVLKEMVNNNRVELLSHPLCTNFLRMKWRKYGFHLNFCEMGLYSLFLAALTCVVINHDPFDHLDEDIPQIMVNQRLVQIVKNNSTYEIETMFTILHVAPANVIDKLSLWYICAYSAVNLLKMMVMLVTMRHKYISFKFLLDLALYVTAAIFAFPFLQHISTHVQWSSMSLCVFLAWFNCLVSLERFDLIGIYVVMFLEILKTLLQVVMIFSLLNVAFGLAFYVQLVHEAENANKNPLLSIYHTFMMLLEIDYISTFVKPLSDDNVSTLHFPYETLLILFLFLMLMPILLINLLIGLAVGDIGTVQSHARLKRLSTQVSFHSDAESKLPYLRSLTEDRIRMFPNRLSNMYFKIYRRILGYTEVAIRDRILHRDASISVEMGKTHKSLENIGSKLDKNMAMMNQIMRHLHMNTEEERWDEGSIEVEGIPRIEEIKSNNKNADRRRSLDS